MNLSKVYITSYDMPPIRISMGGMVYISGTRLGIDWDNIDSHWVEVNTDVRLVGV